MSILLNEVNKLVFELRSDKVATRNKAIELLDKKLTNSKDELLDLLNALNVKESDLSWTSIFNSTIEATIQHAANLEELRDRSYQTMVNKKHFYSTCVNKLIELNLEAPKHFLAKSSIFSSFCDGISLRSTVVHFGLLFINLLDRGIYKSTQYVRELRVNEYSRILSYLFEVNVGGDELLRLNILKSITKSVKLATEHVQINSDLIDYLPELQKFAKEACDARCKAEVISLYHIFIKVLAIDYHSKLCVELQEILPLICEFHDVHDMKNDTKETFFEFIHMSLHVIYPHVEKGDFNTINIAIQESWPKTIEKLHTIINIEIRNCTSTRSHVVEAKCSEGLISVTALLVYVKHWHLESNMSLGSKEVHSSKISRTTDKLETVIGYIQLRGNTFDDIWFAIFANLVKTCDSILFAANIHMSLEIVCSVLRIIGDPNNFQSVHICLEAILNKEQQLQATRMLTSDYLHSAWTKIIDLLITESSVHKEVIEGQQRILQLLIRHGKATPPQCSILLQHIMSNGILKRNECLGTIREMFQHPELCGIDKSAKELGKIISWAFATTEKINATKAIHNIPSFDAVLLADTFAVGVINFNNKYVCQSQYAVAPESLQSKQLQLLMYKHNRKLICLAEFDGSLCKRRTTMVGDTFLPEPNKNCLFQTNYALLMRTMEYEPNMDVQRSFVLFDLIWLYKLSCLMERFLYYNIFDCENYKQCVLIKRIGFFLSHLEFQLKNNNPREQDAIEINEILQQLELVFNIYTKNTILLKNMENQPLEELIVFVAAALQFSSIQLCANEVGDWSNVSSHCLTLLAILCASISHCKEAFMHIAKHNSNISTSQILKIIAILCSFKNIQSNIAKWIVDKLKYIFREYHAHVEVMDEVVNQLPAIVCYVYAYDEELNAILIALMSLLKIAFKKSYSTHLTVCIVQSISFIAQRCADIFKNENFAKICLSVPKFLKFPAIRIQFITIKTIMSLMNINWVSENPANSSEHHMYFCESLYDHIEWPNFPVIIEETNDQHTNSVAVVLQLLVSLFAFSTFHNELALQELVYFCALHKLKEVDFLTFRTTVVYYGHTLRALTLPYVERSMHKWCMKEYPISKFPYFIFFTTKEEFYREHLAEIAAATVLYRTADELWRLKKFSGERDVFELALPLVHAYVLPQRAKCKEAESVIFQQHLENVCNNLTQRNLDNFDYRNNVITLYNLFKLLKDATELRNLLGYITLNAPFQWYHINAKTLLRCLHYSLFGNVNVNIDISQLRIKVAEALVSQHKLMLVELFGILKSNCFDFSFTSDKLHNFFLYCFLAEMIIDNCKESSTSATQNCYKYLLRDIIFFLVNLLQAARACELQKVVLMFLHKQLAKPQMHNDIANNILKTYLNEICKPLVMCAQHTATAEICASAIGIISELIETRKSHLADTVVLLDEFPALPAFSELRKCQFNMHCSWRENGNNQLTIETFLKTKNRSAIGLHALRPVLAKDRANIPHNALRLELISRLIAIVRNSNIIETQLDAARCLGEIGPLVLPNISYYFQTSENINVTQPTTDAEPILNFVRIMYQNVERHLLQFNSKAQNALINVAQHVVNCNSGRKLLVDHPSFEVFSLKSINSNFLENYHNIAPLNWLDILQSCESHQYEHWICVFMSQTFASCGWLSFSTLAGAEYSFADASLQPFIKLILTNNPQKQQHLRSLTKMLDHFFEACSNTADSSTCTDEKLLYKETRAIVKMLNICECIRIVNNWEIPISNLCNVVRASNYCQAFFLSILYLELWWARNAINDTEAILIQNNFQQCAKQAYESIGCFDAMSVFYNSLSSRLDYLNLDNHWPDILLGANSTDIETNQVYTDVLKHNGMLNLASMQHKANHTVDYEICWRLGQWQEPVEGNMKVNTLNDMEREFKKHHFIALKSIKNREENNSLTAISNAQRCIVGILREISTECLQSVYKYLTWLNMLQQANDFCKLQFPTTTLTATQASANIFEKWQTELELQYGSFTCKEHILTHQTQLFRIAGVRANRMILEYYKNNPIESYLLKTIQECKHAGEMSMAKRNIVTLKEMTTTKDATKLSVLLEDADVSFKTGHPQIAKAILEHVVSNKDFNYCLQRITATRMQGEYLMEAKAENFEIVLKHYLEASLKLLEHFESTKDKLMEKFPDIFKWENFTQFMQTNRKCAYESIARYADREYKQLNAYLNSEEYQRRLIIIQKNRTAANSVNSYGSRDRRIGAISMHRFANLDEKELQSIEEKCTEYLCTAIMYYVQYCKVDETFSSATIFRIIALWFANKQNVDFLKRIDDGLPQVPSYKFICALNQVTAHLNSQTQVFHNALVDLLIRCGRDHPQQSLYQLLPLVFAGHDDSALAVPQKNDRVKIATKIISRIRNESNAECCRQLEVMFPALIDFANTTAGQECKGAINLSHKLERLRNLHAVQCPTIELNVLPHKEYRIISIVRWEKQCYLVGGINVPKKLLCLCSDGKTRPQLLKGKDDLRQDSVMQQVFALINTLLCNEPETVQRKLHIRTYKITPLSMRSGILEWCENTLPVGVYLMGSNGKSGAHNKYRPNDYKVPKCRSLLTQVLKDDPVKRYEVYKQLCVHIKPVFQFFLLEKFLEPGIWFERRLAYSNSVATTSIVGYVLGIGDRHTQNILIDEETAEVVHIDFGIAFEQGKVMPTPETVPFRLSRDMVAPMGMAETNGVFTKSSVATMSILRRYKLVVTTILEVLLYDPLYIWNVVPQNDSYKDEVKAEKNYTAQRALIAVQNKLEGRENDILGSSNVEVQVQRLINEARSARNLCMLYPGWDPYL